MARRQRKSDSELVSEAREFFSERESAESENRQNMLDDLKFAFLPGAQWDSNAQMRRQGRPCYSYNRVAGAINQVVGDQRMVHPSGKVRAVNDRAKVGVAETISGLIRDIEAQSNARAIYDAAFKYAVAGGWGVWRVVPEYADEESFDQVLRIRRVRNPLTAFFDQLADEFGRGAQRVLIADRISTDSYRAQFGDRAWQNLPVARDSQGWVDQNEVRIGEFYRMEFRSKKIALLSDGRVMESNSALQGEIERLRAAGLSDLEVVRERVVKEPVIIWAKIDGAHVLEGPFEYRYDHIPCIRLPGRYVNIEGKDYFQSLILHSKDAQRTYNYDRSNMVETVALSPRAPYLATPKMIKGLESWWDRANTANFAYLPFNIDPDSPQMMPKREMGPEIPQAYMALAAHDAEDIKQTTGYINPAIEQQTRAGDAESGRALRTRLMAGDSGSYEFLDNLGKAIQFTHECIISMIPEHYDTQRVIRILGADGREDFVDYDPAEIKKARFDVTVTLGPSYATSRMEALDTLLEASTQMPEIREEAPDIIVRNLDVRGSDEIEKRIRKRLILQGKIPPTPEEAEEIGPPPPPDPTQMALVAQLEAKANRDNAAAQKTQVEAAERAASASAAERKELLEMRQMIEETRKTQAETLLILKELRQPVDTSRNV